MPLVRTAVLGSAVYRDEDFPGCESFHLPASELDRYEGRLEFWDGVTETAWKVCEPTSIYHEQPSRRLGRIAERVASLRGSAMECFGSADLVRRDAVGRKHWLMQADEELYLNRDWIRLQGPAIEVDADPLPDVVLEVDHSTDVRRRKLGVYKESGFPEIWVLVPWDSSVRAPGLAIHVRRGAGYREEGESRAFPGLEGGGDPSRADRGADVGEGVAGAGTDRAGDGCTRGHGTGARSAHPLDQPRGGGKGPQRDARGERAHGAEGPGHRVALGPDGVSRALRRAFERDLHGSGARMHRRGRLPATGPRATRPARAERTHSGASTGDRMNVPTGSSAEIGGRSTVRGDRSGV